jgi:hypothetical protein
VEPEKGASLEVSAVLRLAEAEGQGSQHPKGGQMKRRFTQDEVDRLAATVPHLAVTDLFTLKQD